MTINPLPSIVVNDFVDMQPVEYITGLNSKRVLIITGSHVSKTKGFSLIVEKLEEEGVEYKIFNDTKSDPTLELVSSTISIAKSYKADHILGIGGGSPLDLAKIVALLIDKDFGIDEIDNSTNRNINLTLIPTSAGTGSEVTQYSILTDETTGVKKGISSNELIPDKVFLYGEMATSMPGTVTAYSGIDALCHAVESLCSTKSNDYSEKYATEAIKLIKENLVQSYKNSENLNYRSGMLLASMYAGIAFGNSSVTAVHAFAYPLGGTYHIPHGLANSVMLLPILKFNKPKITVEIEKIGKLFETNDLLIYLKDLLIELKIPLSLKELGVPESSLDTMAHKVIEIKRLLDVNPREITLKEAQKIYREAYSE